jgi:hypothetical protein
MVNGDRRINAVERVTAHVVFVSFLCLACCGGTPAIGDRRGARTSDEAARRVESDGEPEGFTLSGWVRATGLVAAGGVADTTETEFPEDDEEGREHLVRDIGIFLVVSAFVGYFIVKVFLEGDTEEPPPTGGGKVIP